MWLVAAADAEAAPVASRRMAERRRKFWGWGYEDQQPPAAEVEQAGRGAREHLGFGPGEVEPPPRLEDVELPPPRIEPPASLAHICRSDPYERVSHAYGKAYRDLVRAFRGRFDHPPDVVAHPGDERELERAARLVRRRGRRGDSLRWRAPAWSAGWSRACPRTPS